MNRILTIIPAYNEEENISKVIAEIKNYCRQTDIIVINDGSEDKTGDLARSAGAVVIDLPYNMGYGATLQTGFKYALRNYACG